MRPMRCVLFVLLLTLLPTTGWQPRPMPRMEAGTLTADAVDGYQTHEG